jgi:hypothetical protein
VCIEVGKALAVMLEAEAAYSDPHDHHQENGFRCSPDYSRIRYEAIDTA